MTSLQGFEYAAQMIKYGNSLGFGPRDLGLFSDRVTVTMVTQAVHEGINYSMGPLRTDILYGYHDGLGLSEGSWGEGGGDSRYGAFVTR